MSTDTRLVVADAVTEAEAIVQAAWICLNHDDDQWERALTAFLVDMPAPRPPLRRRAVAAAHDRPASASARHADRWPRRRRSSRRRVRATQRSPPLPW